jgi:hypothetical protein
MDEKILAGSDKDGIVAGQLAEAGIGDREATDPMGSFSPKKKKFSSVGDGHTPSMRRKRPARVASSPSSDTLLVSTIFTLDNR